MKSNEENANQQSKTENTNQQHKKEKDNISVTNQFFKKYKTWTAAITPIVILFFIYNFFDVIPPGENKVEICFYTAVISFLGSLIIYALQQIFPHETPRQNLRSKIYISSLFIVSTLCAIVFMCMYYFTYSNYVKEIGKDKEKIIIGDTFEKTIETTFRPGFVEVNGRLPTLSEMMQDHEYAEENIWTPDSIMRVKWQLYICFIFASFFIAASISLHSLRDVYQSINYPKNAHLSDVSQKIAAIINTAAIEQVLSLQKSQLVSSQSDERIVKLEKENKELRSAIQSLLNKSKIEKIQLVKNKKSYSQKVIYNGKIHTINLGNDLTKREAKIATWLQKQET